MIYPPGELADGLYVDLNTVPKKYEGLDGTELAISESQERMAVVVAPEDVDAFIAAARACILKQDVKTSAEASFFCHASRTAFLIVFDEFRRKISVCFCTFGRAVVVIDGRAEAGRF